MAGPPLTLREIVSSGPSNVAGDIATIQAILAKDRNVWVADVVILEFWRYVSVEVMGVEWHATTDRTDIVTRFDAWAADEVHTIEAPFFEA